jgi:phospholipase C
MAFAYRTHEALIELSPGEVGLWRLPPMTPGTIIVQSFYAMPSGWHSSTPATPSEHGSGTPQPGLGDHAGGAGLHTRLGRLDADPGAASPATPDAGGGTIRRDQPRFPTRGLGGLGDFDVLDPDIGGSFGPTMELTLELLRGGHVVPDLNPQSHTILHQTPNSGDIWALRVSRKQDGSLERRRYRIHVQYPSVLPVLTRTIPMGFFNRGFARNWDNTGYIAWAYLEGGLLAYKWDEQFALLYDKPRDDQYVALGSDRLKLPHITLNAIRVLAGGEQGPIAGQGQMPFFKLRLEFSYRDSRTVEFEIPGPNASAQLPDPLWADAKFYLSPYNQGTIGYYVAVESPLLDALNRNITYPSASHGTETINVKQVVKKAIEDYLYRLQFSESGNLMDRYLRPWLVGRYEVENVSYEPNADAMVLSYVGRQTPPHDLVFSSDTGGISVHPDLVSDGGGSGAVPTADAPRLFDLPFEEPLPPEGFGVDPTPLHGVSPGALSKIEHIVVLMQENRSFDQVLGYLSRDGMLPRSKLLSGDESAGREPLQDHIDGLLPGDNARDAIRFPDQPGGHMFRSARTRTTAWPSFGLDNPCHGHSCVERQIADGMKGFVADFARKPGNGQAELQLIMNYLTDAELPAYGALTRDFAICDRWFCSHIGGTLPNRFISLTGDLSEDIYGSPEAENPDLGQGFAPLEARTFFDYLTARNVPWKLFEHGYSMLRLIRNFTFDETNIANFANPTDGFVAVARAGRLPAVSFIEPDYIEAPDGNDDHAPVDMFNGQRLIATIVNALLASPQWEKTLLIITYDEHGGFYDHVPLPYQITHTAADGTTTTRDIPPLANGERRLGVRVPTFVISPFIPSMPDGKVNVANAIYDHTTIPATILRRFCGPIPPNLGARMAGMPDLRDVLTLDVPRPSSDFSTLAAEMTAIANRPPAPMNGQVPPAPLRAPAPDRLEDDFHGLIAYASSVTGVGPR